MKAVQMTEFGDPEVLVPVELPEPRADAGQVVINVAASEVLFLDVQLRKGWGGDYFSIEPPFVLGVGVAGVVDAVGAGVDPSWIGRRVIAGLGESGSYAGGGYAERAVAPAAGVHHVPDGLSLETATAAISDGVMGVSRLEYAALQAGDVIVVTAAAGGIAAWVIPQAVAAGVTVVAMARGEKGEMARRHGAQVLIDYGRDGWHQDLVSALAGRAPAAVFDGSGGEVGQAVWQLAQEGTRFFSYGSGSEEFTDTSDAEQRGIRVWGLDDPATHERRHHWTETALEWLADGRVQPVIGQRVPFSRAADAHRAIEARTVAGKTVLIPDANR